MSNARLALFALGLPSLMVAGCEDTGTSEKTEDDLRGTDEVLAEAARLIATQGSVRLVAQVAPAMPNMVGPGNPDRTTILQNRSLALRDVQLRVERLLPTGAVLTRSYEQMPFLVVDVSESSALGTLGNLDGVVAWHLDERHERNLATSLPQINQPEAATAGFTGAGTAVAVLDTGLDYTHADFGSCSAPGRSGCRVVAMEEVAPDDGSLDDNGHGTNVAAIVGGVAPDTDLIGMDVFRTDGYAYSSDILSAIDWVVTNQRTYNIVALNMSLGGGQYTAECSTSAYEVAMYIAKDAGVASAVATGNDGWSNSISSPACAPSAIKVGAVYTQSYGRVGWGSCTDSSTAADQVTCFSNSASFIDLLAPGAIIDAGGYRMGGTSQATPHVAGALAVLAQAYPTETPDDWTDRLVNSGSDVSDARNGVIVPRIDVEAAVQDAVQGEAPTVSLSLDDGAVYTNYRGVDATLVVRNGTSAATEMCLANADSGVPSSCSDWTTLDEDGRWWLSSGQGEKTVAVWVRDSAGRTSDPATASIVMDTIPPEDDALDAAWDGSNVVLEWGEATDDRSGVDVYQVVHDVGGNAPEDCDSGELVYEGTATSTDISGLSASEHHSFRVCAFDEAGNLSPGVTDTVAADGTLYGTITINGGARYTSERWVTLTFDAEGATELCLTNSRNCPEGGWQPYETELEWLMPSSQGERTVSVWFRNAAGSISEVSTAQIFTDFDAPEAGSVTASKSMQTGRTRVEWSGFSDEGSGLAYLRVVPVRGNFGTPSCTVYGVMVEPEATSAVVDFSLLGPSPRVGLCAVDAAGNESILVETVVR